MGRLQRLGDLRLRLASCLLQLLQLRRMRVLKITKTLGKPTRNRLRRFDPL